MFLTCTSIQIFLRIRIFLRIWKYQVKLVPSHWKWKENFYQMIRLMIALIWHLHPNQIAHKTDITLDTIFIFFSGKRGFHMSCKLSHQEIFHMTCKALSTLQNGPRYEKTCLWGFANNTGANQPVHPHSLISTFVIRFLQSIICKLATNEISIV